MAQPGDQLGDFVPGELAALAGLGPLRHLDLQLAAMIQVFRGHPEAAGGHLFDRGTRVVAVRARSEVLCRLAAFAGIGTGADPVHRDGQRLVRLRRKRAERHAGGEETAADLGDALHLFERDRRSRRLELQEIAHRDRRQLAQPGRIAFEQRVVLGGDGGLQQMDQHAVPGVRLAAVAGLVEAADRQHGRLGAEGLRVQLQHLRLDAGKADAGDS